MKKKIIYCSYKSEAGNYAWMFGIDSSAIKVAIKSLLIIFSKKLITTGQYLIDNSFIFLFIFLYTMCFSGMIISTTNLVEGNYKGLNLIIVIFCASFIYLTFFLHKKWKQKIENSQKIVA